MTRDLTNRELSDIGERVGRLKETPAIRVAPVEDEGSDASYVMMRYIVPNAVKQVYVEYLVNLQNDVPMLLGHIEMQNRRITAYTRMLQALRQSIGRAREALIASEDVFREYLQVE